MSLDLQSHLMMASIDFTRLQSFVENLRVKLNADGALFRYLDYSDWTYPITLVCGSGLFQPEFFKEYDTKWGMSDPHIRVGVNRQLPDKTVYICSEHYPPEMRKDDPYFRDFLPAYDIEWFAGYLAQIDNQYGAGFAIVRRRGREPFNGKDREFLQPVVDMLDDSVRMLLHGQRQKLVEKALNLTLSKRALYGACIDGQGRVLWKSPEAEKLFQSFKALQIKDGKLVSRSSDGADILDGIKQVAKTGMLGDTHKGDQLVIPRADGAAVSLTMAPVRAEEGTLGKSGLGACVLLGEGMVVAADPGAVKSGVIAGLTKAEMQIAERIAKGMTAPDIAEELGVKPSTVRTHMKHTYRKLGINSKAELSALYVNAIRGEK